MRILIAGIGNIFLGDDAFGSEVASELMQHALPPEVRVVDFGIRGYDLAFAVAEGYDAVILVDATPRGEAPGTVYLMEPELNAPNQSPDEMVNAHGMNPDRVIQMARLLGGAAGRLYLVGCEPAVLEADDIGLSAAVREAVPQAIAMIQTLLNDLLANTYRNARAGSVPA